MAGKRPGKGGPERGSSGGKGSQGGRGGKAGRGAGPRDTTRGSSGSGPRRTGGRSDAPARRGAGGGAGESSTTGGPSQGRGDSQGRTGGRGGRSRAPGAGRNAKRVPKRALGGDQVEGRQAVRELLLAGTRHVREIYMIDELDSAEILDDIAELAQDMRIPMRVVSRRHFDAEALTESHQGVLARAAELPEHELDTLAQKPGAFLLVLDGITDPGNVGAMLRTAECAGVTGIVLPRYRAVHVSPTVTKIAAGAIEHLPMTLVPGIPAALTRLKDLGVLTVGLDMGGEASIFDLPIKSNQPIALVLGAEGKGLSRLVRERVDVVAQIPMTGNLNSLNVAMASAVACFEVVRQRTGNPIEEAT